MDIHIFSGNKSTEKFFEKAFKSKEYDLHQYPLADLTKKIQKISKDSLIYVDLSTAAGPALKKTLTSLSKLAGYNYGIIDPKDAVQDIAELFHNGAADYIGKSLYKNGVDLKRMKKIISLKGIEASSEKMTAPQIKRNYIPSGNNWKEIKSGQEYTFVFLLVEIDNKQEIKSLGREGFNIVVNAFHEYLEYVMGQKNGKIWIWMDFGGLILFPFDGKKCDAILDGIRLLLNKWVISAEEFDLDILLSYRIAMHIGTTVYKSRGDTGTIISDTINSVFHLGQKFAKEGGFYLTDEIFDFVPGKMKKCFDTVGEYEGRTIMKLKDPWQQ